MAPHSTTHSLQCSRRHASSDMSTSRDNLNSRGLEDERFSVRFKSYIVMSLASCNEYRLNSTPARVESSVDIFSSTCHDSSTPRVTILANVSLSCSLLQLFCRTGGHRCGPCVAGEFVFRIAELAGFTDDRAVGSSNAPGSNERSYAAVAHSPTHNINCDFSNYYNANALYINLLT